MSTSIRCLLASHHLRNSLRRKTPVLGIQPQWSRVQIPPSQAPPDQMQASDPVPAASLRLHTGLHTHVWPSSSLLHGTAGVQFSWRGRNDHHLGSEVVLVSGGNCGKVKLPSFSDWQVVGFGALLMKASICSSYVNNFSDWLHKSHIYLI